MPKKKSLMGRIDPSSQTKVSSGKGITAEKVYGDIGKGFKAFFAMLLPYFPYGDQAMKQLNLKRSNQRKSSSRRSRSRRKSGIPFVGRFL